MMYVQIDIIWFNGGFKVKVKFQLIFLLQELNTAGVVLKKLRVLKMLKVMLLMSLLPVLAKLPVLPKLPGLQKHDLILLVLVVTSYQLQKSLIPPLPQVAFLSFHFSLSLSYSISLCFSISLLKSLSLSLLHSSFYFFFLTHSFILSLCFLYKYKRLLHHCDGKWAAFLTKVLPYKSIKSINQLISNCHGELTTETTVFVKASKFLYLIVFLTVYILYYHSCHGVWSKTSKTTYKYIVRTIIYGALRDPRNKAFNEARTT